MKIPTMADPNQVIPTLTPAEVADLTNAMASSPSHRARRSTTGAASTSSTPTEKPPAPTLPGKHQSKKQLLFEQIEAINEEPPQLPPLQPAQPPLQPPVLPLIQQTQQNVCDWSQAIPCKFPSLPLLNCQADGRDCLVHHICQGKWERCICIQIPLHGIVASIIPTTSIKMHQQRTIGVHRIHLPFHQMKCSLQQVQWIRPSLEWHLSAIEGNGSNQKQVPRM